MSDGGIIGSEPVRSSWYTPPLPHDLDIYEIPGAGEKVENIVKKQQITSVQGVLVQSIIETTLRGIGKEFPKPVKIENDKIAIDERFLEIGEYYPIEYKEKKYLIHKQEEGKIVLYEVLN